MCLSIILEKKKISKEPITAWKAFYKNNWDSKLKFSNQIYKKSSIVPRGKWIKADGDFNLYCNDDKPYKTGFHTFISSMGAQNYSFGTVSMKVLIKHVHTIGKQSGCKVNVSNYMYVPAVGEKIMGNKIVKVKKNGSK